MHRPRAFLDPFFAANLSVFLHLALGNAIIENATALIQIESEKERHTNSLVAAIVLHTVHGAHVTVVSDALHVIRYVDNEGARDRLRVDPLTLAIQDLQAAVVVLP
ncbi:hypothetical protein RRF57_012133 [Xylaria bambusicola]|uniref:RNase H type-1 domain-containing protein n=1 Tax=Xylaria bambusicola TaxID=326684 RepID=A0AAN7V1E0_9PEZI